MSGTRPIRRKLVIVGDGAAGKTSSSNVFAVGEFPQTYEPTVFDNYVTDIELDGKPIQLALWDTAGQEEYERLRPSSYSKAHIILIAYSVDTPDSLDNVTQKWIEEVRNICGSSIPVILVACKRDSRDKAIANGTYNRDEFIDEATGRVVAERIGAKAFHETSASSNEGVLEVFEAATRAAMTVRDAGYGGVGESKREREYKRREKEDRGVGKCCVIC